MEGVQLGPVPVAGGFPAAAAAAVAAAVDAAAADVMYEGMAGFVPLKAKIAAAVAAAVVAAADAAGPDDGGRALPTADLAAADASMAAAAGGPPRCGGAAGELDADEEAEDDVSEISVPFSVECDDDAAMDEYCWR